MGITATMKAIRVFESVKTWPQLEVAAKFAALAADLDLPEWREYLTELEKTTIHRLKRECPTGPEKGFA